MAKAKKMMIVFSVLSLAALVAAISMTVIGYKKCSLMIGRSTQCGDNNAFVCCNCCNYLDPDCLKSCKLQALEGFGIFIIVLFWGIFAGCVITTFIFFLKFRSESRGTALLS